MDKYEIISKIGEGTYGSVYKAKHHESGKILAVKGVQLIRDQELPDSIVREISLLKELDHKNIVKIYKLFHKETEVILVFDFFEYDLRKYLETFEYMITPAYTHWLMFQLMKGLAFCHSKRVLHRDLKPDNLLISPNGELKIAGFGSAKYLTAPITEFASEVVYIWYRPPEILFGATHYTTTIDTWSAGCIFAEISNKGVPFFPGKNEDQQLNFIFRILGTPTNHSWPGVQNLPKYKTFPRYPFIPLWSSYLPDMTPAGHDLISKLLVCDPAKRITSNEALNHPYFTNSL